MSRNDEKAREVSRKKLRLLEEHYTARKLEPVDDAHVRELSLRSIKRVINQLKEEIGRLESHHNLQLKNR